MQVLVLVGLASGNKDPLAQYTLEWTGQIRWDNIVDISMVAGPSLAARLNKAQKQLQVKGGGVVYFPAGEYAFADHIHIKDGIVLRGADPEGQTDARRDDYNPPTRFAFPRYQPRLEEEGTPIETAFKGIYLENPDASHCGLLNIAIHRGHIDFTSEGGHQTGRNRFVVGCLLTNAAVADPGVPDARYNQHPWQRFTARHHAAVTVNAYENILVANNRLPESGEDNFTMNDFIVREGRIDGVVFDYDNRPGLYINDAALGGAGGNGPDGTPETHPWGFRKGIVIRDNYIFCTGRCAISFTGEGTICADNVIRFKDNVWLPTTTGTNRTTGSATNDNRAVQMRGWRWTVAGNDYLVFRNLCYDRKYRINDGEGLMHEDHVNSTVLDSRILNNKGNSYISIYKTAGINGLLVKGNDIRTSGGISAIYVVANRNSGPYECCNVTIEDNITAGSGIQIAGDPSLNNSIRNNVHVGGGGKIINEADAILENNAGYDH
ncbi:MAG: hypothetical protein JW828_10140 [Sedimentisphaerales bacterium]|nr:hypothetical protein [Sedimentisphaerales bacterium]